jgi:hypothetical protein
MFIYDVIYFLCIENNSIQFWSKIKQNFEI